MSLRRANGGIIGSFAPPTTVAAPGCWSVNEMAALKAYSQFWWPASAADASFASVKLLVHMQNDPVSNGNIRDWSGNSHHLQNGADNLGVAAHGLTALWSHYATRYPGGSNIGTSYSGTQTDFQYGTGDFTEEVWFYLRASGSGVEQTLIDHRGNPPGVSHDPTFKLVDDKLTFYENGTTRIQAGSAASLSTWHHGILSRVSGTTYLGLDGSQVSSSYSDSNNYSSGQLNIGTLGNNTATFSGLIGEIRITKGVGRYSGGSYTVPTAPFPDH
jgi:hypothetical protein